MTRSPPRRRLTRWELVQTEPTAASSNSAGHKRPRPVERHLQAVWAVNLSKINRPGTYRLVLLHTPRPSRPGSGSGRPRPLYRKPLENTLSFYQNERDGPDFIHSTLRPRPAHLNDASAMTYRQPTVDENGNFKGSLAKYATGVRINATGGWFDAGDYLHFTETTSYTVGHAAPGHRVLPPADGRPRPSQTSPARRSSASTSCGACGTRRPRRSTYEVGTGEANSYYFADHDIWRLPQADDHYMGSNPHYHLHPAPAGVPRRASRARCSARTWPAGSPPTSRSATTSSGRPTRATRTAACARPRRCTRWPTRTGRAT